MCGQQVSLDQQVARPRAFPSELCIWRSVGWLVFVSGRFPFFFVDYLCFTRLSSHFLCLSSLFCIILSLLYLPLIYNLPFTSFQTFFYGRLFPYFRLFRSIFSFDFLLVFFVSLLVVMMMIAMVKVVGMYGGGDSDGGGSDGSGGDIGGGIQRR